MTGCPPPALPPTQHAEAVELLLRHGAGVDYSNDAGLSALGAARRSGAPAPTLGRMEAALLAAGAAEEGGVRPFIGGHFG
jgi:hypothetical protein